MNERIRELADQCYYLNACNLPLFNKEKFAKLIVRECANIDFRRELGLSSDQDYEVSQLIKKHFGVKE